MILEYYLPKGAAASLSYPLADEDRDRLLVGIAIRMGVLNERTFRCPSNDTCCTKAEQDKAMKSLYNKVRDEHGDWTLDTL